MNYDTIRGMPTTVTGVPSGTNGVHESCLRAYQILEKVKWLLNEGSSSHVVLELIKMMELGNDNA